MDRGVTNGTPRFPALERLETLDFSPAYLLAFVCCSGFSGNSWERQISVWHVFLFSSFSVPSVPSVRTLLFSFSVPSVFSVRTLLFVFLTA